MALDLSALEEKPAGGAAPVVAAPTGKPLDLRLADIEEDPDQPRKEFTEQAMQEMEASIRARGVKTPVSVRKHPTKPGKWILNYGARRYRGSKAAGKETIPAFVDESHDDYDQVIENIQREDLKPMELALFIQRRLVAGDKKQTIAKKLGKDAAIITQHLALIDPPACVEEAYTSGKCLSPKTLYELRGLHDKYPEQVDSWCAEAGEITRRSVSDLAATLAAPASKKTVDAGSGAANTEGGESGKFGHDQIPGGAGSGATSGNPTELTGGDSQGANPERKDKKPKANGGEGSGTGDGDDEGGKDTGELTSWPKGRAISDPDRMSKPLMLVEYDGRSAAVLLNRRPSSAGLLHIRFEDGGGDQEVDAGLCKINLLTESAK